MKFKVGDKVKIPLTKSAPGWDTDVSRSSVVKKAKELNQPYLFVREVGSEIFVLSELSDGKGDYFHINDLVPYSTVNTYEVF